MGSTQSPSSAINAAIDALVPFTKVASIEALNATSAKVTFTAAVESVKVANFVVTNEDDDLVFVSAAELSADKMSATLTFFDEFVDGETYKVVTSGITDVNGNAVTDTDSFTYEYADPAKVEFTGTTIIPGDNVVDLVKVTDKLGRDITDEVAVEFETSNVAVVAADGDAAGEGTAIVVAKVNVDGTYVKSNKTVITVTDATADSFAGSYVYTTASGAALTTADFKELADDEKIDFVNMGVTTKSIALYYNDQFGEDTLNAVTAFNGVGQPTLTNLNPGVVIVNNNGTITPISAGNGYVKVVNGDITTTVKIVVKEASKVATMTPDPTSVAVSTSAGVNTKTIEITYKDQFGTEVTPAPATNLTVETADEDIATVSRTDINNVVVTGVAEGTTTVTLTYEDDDVTLEKTVNVTVTEAGTLAGYTIDNEYTKIDVSGVAVPDVDQLPDASDVDVFSVDSNGVKIAKIALDGTTNKLVEVDENGDAVEVADELVDITYASGTATVEAAEVGTAYVQVQVGSLVVDTLEYEVVDTAATATTIEFDAVTIAAGEINAVGFEPSINAHLEDIITVKDQFGEEVTGGTLAFAYVITNKDGVTFTGVAGSDEDIATVTKQAATADIVITSITVDGGDNLLTTPQVVKLSVKDTTAPIATLTSATYDVDSGALVVTGTFDTDSAVDVTKIIVNGVTLTSASTAVVTNATTLTVTVAGANLTAVNASTGFDTDGAKTDALAISAGLLTDDAGNLSIAEVATGNTVTVSGN